MFFSVNSSGVYLLLLFSPLVSLLVGVLAVKLWSGEGVVLDVGVRVSRQSLELYSCTQLGFAEMVLRLLTGDL